MTPVLVTAPTADVVSLHDMKQHLRVDHDEDDALIVRKTAAAVAQLDGYTGILGRAIMPQKWAQEWRCGGPYRLALPDVDVDSIVVTVDGSPSTDFETELTPLGTVVTVGTSGNKTRIEYECALPAHLLPAVQQAVMLLVAHDYENREPTVEVPLAFDAVVAPLRKERV